MPTSLFVIPAALTVIPAKAGIHTPAYRYARQTGVLDSGLRRNDGGGGGNTREYAVVGCGFPLSRE